MFYEAFFSEWKNLKNNRPFGRFRHFHYLAIEIYIENSEDGSGARGTPLASKLSLDILGTLFGHQKEHQSRTACWSDEKVKFWTTLVYIYIG